VSKSDYLQRFVRSRPVRLALAFALMGAGGWALFPHMLYRVAPSAFVNAELVRVAAPISGRLTHEIPGKGDYIDRSTNLPLIDSLASDRRHLFDLERQLAVSQERGGLARKQLTELGEMDRELTSRTDGYREGMVRRLSQEVYETSAERTGCLAEVNHRREVGSRMEQLVGLGVASDIRAAEARASEEAASARCAMAQARLARLQVELEAARTGVFLGDGANDVPYSQQQRDRLLLRRQELEAQQLEESSRSAKIAMEIEMERERVERLSRFHLFLPDGHVVWAVAASPGSTVTEGQTVLDLANCGERFVVVELPEREFEQIKGGDTAAVRLSGSHEWHAGTVRQVRGSAARADDRLLAAQVPIPNPGNITVEVALASQASPARQNSFCDIGRLAEVRFTRQLGIIADFGRSLAQLISGRRDIGVNTTSN
jgi:multidrug resistance efflux pump